MASSPSLATRAIRLARIGLDVAIEALTEYRRKHGSVDALMKAAAVDREAVVLQPYLEAIS